MEDKLIAIQINEEYKTLKRTGMVLHIIIKSLARYFFGNYTDDDVQFVKDAINK